MHGAVLAALQTDVIVETALLELDIDVLEVDDEPFDSGQRGRGVLGYGDVQPEVVVLAVRRRIVGRLDFALSRLYRRVARRPDITFQVLRKQ